ncbi:hypothetical protein HDG34_003594 [Paraburkholderia sp. HC6.4b]|uniref:YaaC family protein n=1 Tax=unclassified Paraburkholderia TaxID=2615204 RepID=UPI001619F41C|nr:MULTISPECIES: YaaC family protein [unclassified Paraburkholderia]MBB5409652.1 hypothetical protein [Paraburkholderia sp. HC6.4b]MBB5451381.1 hypothetical protein [Paraburkholderia sp. Kb1A]
MIIKNCATYSSSDVAKYAWTRLAHYQNIDAVTRHIMTLHALPERHRANAKRQATQIRQCLMQAREYFEAAQVVSLATRPVLLYYSIMSLALCEILFKQTADSRLEKLREEHGCHGLSLTLTSQTTPADTLEASAAALIAKPQLAPNGSGRGTFEVWRRSSRELPLSGQLTQSLSGTRATTSGHAVLAVGVDQEPPRFPNGGRSLLSVLQSLPQMVDVVYRYDLLPELVRAKCTATSDITQINRTTEVTVHPGPQHLIDAFANQISLPSSEAPRINAQELPSGLIFSFPQDTAISLPWCVCIDTKTVWLSTRQESLTEFGLLYVGLHIAGNFARYYPDKWLAHIDASSPLALAIDKLTEAAFERAPLLTLCELTRVQLLREA